MKISAHSVDPQKMIILPRMPGNKTTITKQIMSHETFTPLGLKKDKSTKDTISIVWYKGITKKNAKKNNDHIYLRFPKGKWHEALHHW